MSIYYISLYIHIVLISIIENMHVNGLTVNFKNPKMMTYPTSFFCSGSKSPGKSAAPATKLQKMKMLIPFKMN